MFGTAGAPGSDRVFVSTCGAGSFASTNDAGGFDSTGGTGISVAVAGGVFRCAPLRHLRASDARRACWAVLREPRPTSASIPVPAHRRSRTSPCATACSTANGLSPSPHGGPPVAAAYRVEPNAKTSEADSEASPRATSGARYAGVPAMKPEAVTVTSPTAREIPKSVIFTVPSSDISRFAGFTSRCTMPTSCAPPTPTRPGRRCAPPLWQKESGDPTSGSPDSVHPYIP